MAEQAGIDWGDYVTGVDVEQTDLPPKELIYPAGLALLGLVFLSQLVRGRRAARASSVTGAVGGRVCDLPPPLYKVRQRRNASSTAA